VSGTGSARNRVTDPGLATFQLPTLGPGVQRKQLLPLAHRAMVVARHWPQLEDAVAFDRVPGRIPARVN
jgi:hypothetical protein